VFALDLLPMLPIDGVVTLQGDLRSEEGLGRLCAELDGRPVDLVLSDMAPNMAGIRAVDQARAMDLAEAALELAVQVLAPEGCMLVKLFQGAGVDEYRRSLRRSFSRLMTRKPSASRDRSRELYLLARGFRVGRAGQPGADL